MREILQFFFPRICLECKTNGKYICANCLKKVEHKSFIGISNYSIWKYEGVIRKAITKLKYRFVYGITAELGEEASEELLRRKFLINKKVILIPIPLHKKRENWRGFNQSDLVGRKISEKMGWSYEGNLLVRSVYTRAQVGLNRESRIKNMKKVFSINKQIKFNNNYLCLVFDDVWTTGATIKEAIKVLREAGVKNVGSLTLVR